VHSQSSACICMAPCTSEQPRRAVPLCTMVPACNVVVNPQTMSTASKLMHTVHGHGMSCQNHQTPPEPPRRDASCCSSTVTVSIQQLALTNAPYLRNPRGLPLYASACTGVAHIHAMSVPGNLMHTVHTKAPRRDAAVGSSTAMVPYTPPPPF
jgi:hypothetical protein